ncbi:MAG TPA: BON domain-containing protein [Caldimonas sp.]|nr:BON domain-containing protein [Caldimonas sp.]
MARSGALASRLVHAIACLACAAPAGLAAAEELRNWFDDPFFAITSAIRDCPLPAGPYITDAERRVQAHHRAERGTTCWLAKACDRPNAYAYDREIGEAIAAAVRERHPFGDTSLWVTVQGRVVYVEGCARSPATAAEVEAFVRTVPNVQQAIANLRTDPAARAPYRLRHPGPVRTTHAP